MKLILFMRVDIEKKNKSRIFAAVKGYSLS
jgi:hypothetical protein